MSFILCVFTDSIVLNVKILISTWQQKMYLFFRFDHPAMTFVSVTTKMISIGRIRCQTNYFLSKRNWTCMSTILQHVMMIRGKKKYSKFFQMLKGNDKCNSSLNLKLELKVNFLNPPWPTFFKVKFFFFPKKSTLGGSLRNYVMIFVLIIPQTVAENT